MINLIVAVDQGGAIGWSDGRLAHPGLKADMRRFKELTTGHIVVMGFNTFKSLDRPNGLPNRHNIVLTRKNPLEARGLFGDNVDVISSLDYVQRISQANTLTTWIIGGASVYEEALAKDLVDEIYLTIVHADSQADVKLTTDLVAWKRFVLTERKRGANWEATPVSRQWDGGVETSYIHFKRT